MKVRFETTNPDEIEMTLSMTMKLHDWKRLKGQLESMSYPSRQLNQHIRDIIELAELKLENEDINF